MLSSRLEHDKHHCSDDIVDDLDTELSSPAVGVPDGVSTLITTQCVAAADVACARQEELAQEISKLRNDIEEIQLAQGAQIKEIRDQVKDDLKTEITEMVE